MLNYDHSYPSHFPFFLIFSILPFFHPTKWTLCARYSHILSKAGLHHARPNGLDFEFEIMQKNCPINQLPNLTSPK